MASVKRPPLVLIEWYDAIAHAPGWLDARLVKSDLPTVQSVGWMIRRTKRSIILVADTGKADSDTNRRIEIPTGMVIGEPIKLGRL